MIPEFKKIKEEYTKTMRKELMAQYEAGGKDVLTSLIKAFDTMTEQEMAQILSFQQLREDLIKYKNTLFPENPKVAK